VKQPLREVAAGAVEVEEVDVEAAREDLDFSYLLGESLVAFGSTEKYSGGKTPLLSPIPHQRPARPRRHCR
jgi:hypothetical protein